LQETGTQHHPDRARDRRHAPAFSTSRRLPLAGFGCLMLPFGCMALCGLLAGCGQQYRPVVAAISPVGPAGQPTKYAVAVANPNGVTQVDTITAYSITGNVLTVTVTAPNPFTAGATVTLTGFPTSTFLNGQTVTVLAAGLSTTQFEANFTHANVAATTEPAAAAVTGTTPGLLTFVDFSGDTVLSTPSILTNPSYFAITDSGVEGFVINAAGSLNDFGMSNPEGLLTANVAQNTLPIASGPVTMTAVTPSSGSQTLFVPETATSKIAILNSSTASLLEEVSVAANPVYVVGYDGAARVYAISQGSVSGATGQIAALEALGSGSFAVSATLPVGIKPVYGIMTTDGHRAYILNQGDGTVSVVNVVNNALDSTTPTIAIPNITYNGGSTAPKPVWADLVTVYNELAVLNQGDGVHPGTLTLINIPLCSASSQVTNPNCNSTNPADATGFGQIVGTVTVGVNPVMVSVLHDGSAAYVANAGNAAAGISGSVSVVSLVSGTVIATIPASSSPTAPVTDVYGHPSSIAATTGTPTGKVYVTSPDSSQLSIIYTDTNTGATHITLQGLGVRVIVTQP